MHSIKYDDQNIFAKILRGEIPSFKIYEDNFTYVLLDIMPQSKGHTLVITKEKAPTIFDISNEGVNACMNTIKKISPALMELTKANGLIVKQFNYAPAGQTIFHLHFHLIPVYEGMPIATHSHVKADMEELKEFAEKFKELLKS